MNARTAVEHAADLAAATLLALLTALLFRGVAEGFWRADDPAILWHAMNSRGFAAFHDPADWQKFSPGNLTPWITLSFKLDLLSGGFEPRWFYAHQMLAQLLVALAGYALARHWLAPLWSLLAMLLFLVGAPTASVAETLMTRHYAEGLLFALLALMAFLQALRRDDMRWALAGALAYALAASATQNYVPLVVLLLVIPQRGWRARLLLAVPYIAVALGYVFWRGWMLGSFAGGYARGESMLSAHTLSAAAETLGRLPEFLLGTPGRPLFGLLGGLIAMALYARRAALPAAVVLTLIVLVPLLPLVAYPGIGGPDHHLYLAWFVLSLASVLAARTAATLVSARAAVVGAIALPPCLLLIALADVHTRSLEPERTASLRQFDALGHYLMQADRRQAFVAPPQVVAGYGYVTNLCEIKQRLGAECPRSLMPGFPSGGGIDHIALYDPQRGTMADVDGDAAALQKRIESIDTARPLWARLELQDGWARWQLGPYPDGRYFIVSPALGRHPVDRTGQLRTALAYAAVQVQYESPQGWSTASPVLAVRSGRPASWQRLP